LGKLPVVETGHFSSDFHQDGLEAIVAIPVGENWELVWVDLSVYLGDEWEVHPRQELDVWVFVRITLATVDLQAVNAVLVHGMSRADDCPVPVAHHDIVRIVEAVRTRAVSDALLALLELLEKPEVSRYLGHACVLIVI